MKKRPMPAKNARRLYFILLLAALAILLAALSADGQTVKLVLSVVGLAVFIAGAVVTVVFWRCPACRKMLPVRGGMGMEFCPFCGNPLEEEAPPKG